MLFSEKRFIHFICYLPENMNLYFLDTLEELEAFVFKENNEKKILCKISLISFGEKLLLLKPLLSQGERFIIWISNLRE